MTDENCIPRFLRKLPKGSGCTEYKDVPARSSYWRDDTDTVERCASFATGGGGGDGDGDGDGDRAPGRDGGGGGGTPTYRDDEGNFTDDRMENAFYWAAQIRGWFIDGPNAGLQGTYCVEIRAGKPTIVLDRERWDEDGAQEIVRSLREHDFPPEMRIRGLEDEIRIFMTPTDQRLKSNYAQNWRDIDPTCTDDHPDRDESDIPPVDRDELPEVIGDEDGEHFSLEHVSREKIRWRWNGGEPPGRPATAPDDVGLVVQILNHGGRFPYKYTATARYRWEDDDGERKREETITAATQSHRDAKENQERVIEETVGWMQDKVRSRRSKGSDVGDWESIKPAGEIGDDMTEIARWRADYPHPLSDDTQYVTVVEIESPTGNVDVAYFAYHHVGQVDNDDPEGKITSSPDEPSAIEAAERYMRSNPPDSVAVNIPKEVNGWERTEFGTEGYEHYDALIDWEGWSPPDKNNPDRRKERVRIFKRDGKWNVRWSYLNGDGESVSTKARDLPTLPKRSSMARGSSTKKSFSDLSDAVEPCVEYMEQNASEIAEWPDVPRFSITTKNTHLKDIAALMKRVSEPDPPAYRLTGARIDRSSIRLVGTDEDNVSMFDMDIGPAGFENDRRDTEPWEFSQGGDCVFNGYEFADAITDANKSETVKIRTLEPREKNDPVVLLLRGGASDAEIPLWPADDDPTDRLPDDLEFTASFDVREARELDDALKEADADAIRFNVTENRVALSWGEGQGNQTILPTSDRKLTDGDSVESVYSIKKLRMYTMSVGRPASTEVNVELAESYPMRFTHRPGVHIVDYYTAPRIETEQPEGDDMDQDENPRCITDGGCVEPMYGRELHEPIKAGAAAPDVDGMDLQNGDSVVLTFPNTDGCRCGAQIRSLEQLAQGNGVDVYAIAASSPEDMADMADRLGVERTELIADPDGQLAAEFGVEKDDDGNLKRRIFFVRGGKINDVTEGMAMPLEQPNRCPTPYRRQRRLQSPEKRLFDVVKHPGVYLTTGKRGSGKSSLAMRIADGLHERDGIKPVTVGMPRGARDHFPGYWLHVDRIEDAPPNSVIVIDEAYAKFHARDAMSDENKSVGKMVNTSRHCQQTYIFVSQNASHLDVNAASEADGLLMKEPGTFHMEFERRQFRDLSEKAKDAFDQLPADINNQEYTYVYTDEHQGMIRNDEAGWFDDDVSRSFSAACDLSN